MGAEAVAREDFPPVSGAEDLVFKGYGDGVFSKTKDVD
jgi:hypothetical protein